MAPRLVIGLGNPGRRYAETRHNAGFLVIDELARRWNIHCTKKQLGSQVGAGLVGDSRVVLVMPQQFMNRSGHPTRSLLGFYKGDLSDIVVIHDDVDLPFGSVRIKRGGGAGGHNGLKDLDRHLGDRNYVRVRLGVSRPPPGWDTADYVLGKWNAAERDDLEGLVGRSADAVETVLHDGLTAAMNLFNVRPKKRKASAPEAKNTAEDGSDPQAPSSSRLSINLRALAAAGV
jgi:PTH1 family peptidyl-tRNA hydrolase